MDIINVLAKELGIKLAQAENAVRLIDEGNTIPFIARYRKEATGSLDDNILRDLDEKLRSLRALEEKREEVRRLIAEQENMTDEISASLDRAVSLSEIEDIYRPFRPKRKTRASVALEAGLEPLADLMEQQKREVNIEAEAENFLNPDMKITDAKAALKGAMDIIAERVSDNADFRKWIRAFTTDTGSLASNVTKAKKDEDSVYRLYYDYTEPIKKIPSHRVLAINRGEKEGYLGVKIDVDKSRIIDFITGRLLTPYECPSTGYVREACEDAYDRLIAPSVHNEIRAFLTEGAEEQAVKVFGENLGNLLMTPPVRDKVVMGFDPAYRTGCKIAVVSGVGDVLETAVVYPTPPLSKVEEAEKKLLGLISKHKVDIISIGNGTASKESEIFVAAMIKKADREVSYIMTNEAGASVYSASKLAAEEFPEYDVSIRSAVSIARRLQDPLAELVKIDPKAIGVGQYQHDINAKLLSSSLDGVVESCVSSVGADLNTASVPLLARIAGINTKTAKNIYDYRTQKGKFATRAELLKVKGIGEKAYIQCAGFLRVPDSKDFLDNTAVHPESYTTAKSLIREIGYTDEDVYSGGLSDISARIEKIGLSKIASNLEVGLPTLEDIISELKKPGRDPRSSLPAQILRTDAMDIGDLKAGMEFVGTVRNVADFGAFVDIGVHQDGLIHISKLAKGFVKRAMDVISVGEIINVRILDVDPVKKRISLERVF